MKRVGEQRSCLRPGARRGKIRKGESFGCRRWREAARGVRCPAPPSCRVNQGRFPLRKDAMRERGRNNAGEMMMISSGVDQIRCIGCYHRANARSLQQVFRPAGAWRENARRLRAAPVTAQRFLLTGEWGPGGGTEKESDRRLGRPRVARAFATGLRQCLPLPFPFPLPPWPL